jgi:O-antigen/teichoic acid export membrane protein
VLKKIFSYGTVEGISKGLNKLVVLALPIFISTDNYGILGLLIAIELILPLITFLGLERAILRFYHFNSKIKNFESTIFKTISFLNFTIISLLLIPYLFGIESLLGLKIIDIILTIILVYLQGSILLFMNMLRVEENHQKYFKLRIVHQISKLLLVLLLTLFIKNYYGYLLGSILSALLIYISLIKQYGRIKEPFNKKTLLLLLNFSWPFILHGVSVNLLGNADKFVINSYMTKSDVGVYSLAYAVGSSMIFAFVGISIYMEPLIYKAKNNVIRKHLLDKFNLYGLIAGLCFYFIICSVFEFIIPNYNLGNYKSISHLVPLVSIGFLLYPFYLSSNWQLIQKKKGILIAVLSIFTATVNIILNTVLIPKYGLMGAVFNSFLTYLCQTLLFLYFAHKKIINNSSVTVLIGGTLILLSFYFNFTFYSISFLFILLILLFYSLSINNNNQTL